MAYNNNNESKLNLVKHKIISSLLMTNYHIIGLCFARVYTAGAHSNRSWLYTELEGALTLVLDYSRKSSRFLLFDLSTLEITFESELYKNFSVFYTCSTETFHCFEVHGGFIGFSIPDKSMAQQFFKSVTALTDQIVAKKLKETKLTNKNEIKTVAARNLQFLKNKLAEEYFFKEHLDSGKKIEFDAAQIEQLFAMIEFDRQTNSFIVNGNSDEIEELMNKVSSVKYAERASHKVNDMTAYAMEIYQNILNTNKLSKVQEQKQKLVPQKNNNSTETKSAITNNPKPATKEEPKSTKTVTPTPVPEAKKVPTTAPNVPAVPKVPAVPNVPAVPKGVPAVPKGVPPVPKGVPAVPKPPTAPKVPSAPKVPPVTPKPNTTDNNGNANEINTNSITTDTSEEKKLVKKKEPPKMDMMSELKMKLANRNKPAENKTEPLPNSTNATPNTVTNITSTASTINKPPSETHEIKINTNTPVKSESNNEPSSVTHSTTPQVTETKSNMNKMMDALNAKMGGGSSKPVEKIQPTVTVPSSNQPKINTNNLIANMEKSYMGGDSETSNNQAKGEVKLPVKETPKEINVSQSRGTMNKSPEPLNMKTGGLISNKKPEVDKPLDAKLTVQPTNKDEIKITSTNTVTNPPKLTPPQVPSSGIPKVPNVPLPPKFKVPINTNVPKTNPTPPKKKDETKELTLLEEISKGIQLKKVVTVEKTGIDYLKKKKDTLSTKTNSTTNEPKTEVKGDLFSEMKKVQLKKINK